MIHNFFNLIKKNFIIIRYSFQKGTREGIFNNKILIDIHQYKNAHYLIFVYRNAIFDEISLSLAYLNFSLFSLISFSYSSSYDLYN